MRCVALILGSVLAATLPTNGQGQNARPTFQHDDADVNGLTFAEAWHGRVSGHYGSEAVDYIGRAELIRNKRTSGRLQDLLDIEGLDAV